MRKVLLLFLAIVFMVVFIGQSHGIAQSQILKMAFDAGDLRTLDPHYASANVDRAVVDLIFNGLVRYKPGNIRMDLVEPDLADKWEVSQDGLCWTFHLRKGVMFHPWGTNPSYELTSEDVVFSLEKAANADSSAYAGSFSGLKFRTLDKYTVEITTDKPMSPFLFLAKVINYAGGFVVSKKAVENMGLKEFRLHPVGTGPFMFQEYKPKDKVVLVRHEKYFRGAPGLEGIEMIYMPDVSARNLALRNGEVDLIEGPMEQAWTKLMKSFPGIKVDVFGPGSTSVIHLNMAKKPFNDIKVRQAVAYAISRDELIAAIGSSVASPIVSPVPVKYLPGGLTEEEVKKAGLLYSADRDKAKKLLTETGYSNGLQVEAIHTEMATMLRPMESIQAQLKKVGIDLNLRVVDHSTFHSMIRKDASQVIHYMAWRPNADVFLTRFYHSASVVVSGSKPDTNFSHYDKIDNQIEQARETVDPVKQVALWKEAQMKILEDLPAIPLFIKQFTLARRDYVDYGCQLESNIGFYAPITEKTKILPH